MQTTLILSTASCSGGEAETPSAGSGGGGNAPSAGKTGGGSGGTSAGGSAGTSAGRGGSGQAGLGGSTGGTNPIAGTGGGSGNGGSGGSTGGTNPAGGSGGTPITSGGTAGQAGSAGGSGPAGAGGAGGSGGATPDVCTFTIDAAASSAIPTVGVVNWTTTLANLTEARIEFTLNGAMADELNKGSGGVIDHMGTEHKALLLGLKPSRAYTYRIIATAGSTVCTSEDQMFTAGARPQTAPTVEKDLRKPESASKGFIITSNGIAFGAPGSGGAQYAYIVDADGEVVWWAPAPANCSRALMNWEGTDMWMLELNVDNAGGEMRRVSMDGMDTQMNVQGLSKTHHDFTVLPGGIVASPSWTASGMDPPSDLIERSPDGTIKTVVRIDQNIYQSNTYHTNSIIWHQSDDTYTLGDRNPNAYVKITHTGEVLWQFGGSCSNAPAPKCASGSWQVNHGHHLLENGNFLFFNNGQGAGGSTAYEYSLTESGSGLTASMVWSYSASGASSMVLGDVQRLPNGNTMIVYSNNGDIHEVDPQKQVVQITSTASLGYARYRDTLYGPPLQ